ncbi:MAG: TolC family protein [Paludibacteraceae bacterium]|nr:TolC family protein [Paludibacteraceae bacterium]
MKHTFLTAFTLVLSTTAFAQQQVALSLADCRRLAIEHNEKVKKSGNALTSAQLQKEAVFTNYLPRLDGSATTLFMQDQDIMGMQLKLRGAYVAGFSLTQPIYVGGKIYNGNKLAKIGIEAAEIQQQQTRADVIAEADNAYWTYIAVLEKQRMVEAYKAQMDSVCAIIKNAIDAEMGTEYELVRVNAKRSELEYQLQKVKNGINLCRMNLCNIIGDSMTTAIVPTDTTVMVTAPSNMNNSVDNRPEVKLLAKNIEAKELQIKMERAEMLPTVGLQAAYNFFGNIKTEGYAQAEDGNYYPYSTNYHGGVGMVAAAVKIPLLNWLDASKKVKIAKLEVENAKLDKEQNARLMGIQVQQAIQNVMDGYAMIETAELGLKQAEENLRIVRIRYENGMGTLTDLLDAQSQWQQAKSNNIEAKTQYKIYETEYLHAVGELDR